MTAKHSSRDRAASREGAGDQRVVHESGLHRHRPALLTRAAILLLPAMIGFGIVLAMTLMRPIAKATLDVREAASISLHFTDVFYPGSLELIDRVVFYKTPLSVAAEVSSVDGDPVASRSVVSIEAGNGCKITHPISGRVEQRTIKFQPRDGSGVDIQLEHLPESDARKFYSAFSVMRGRIEMRLIYAPSSEDHEVRVEGGRVTFTRAAGGQQTISADENKIVVVRFRSGGSPATLVAPAATSSDRFANLHYAVEKKSDAAEFLPKPTDGAVTLAESERPQLRGEITLNVLDLTTIQYPNAAIHAEGSGLTVLRAIEGSASGMRCAINGDFRVLDVDGGGGPRHLLPSYLARTREIYAVLFAALAYLLDKTVTIFTFLKGEK